ncbi:hypothetical protein C2G38_2201142 [Gigaspora rosea]|uniref:Uncharacterized protein n=1 Tax=Gigaspora rosea TaxID=44941 RepID=A0A397UPN0_9GLOM|nr:hypothetical protein C2G38_2201142 [Gigaspora rosea]
MSEANTPVSTSTSSTANGNESFTHADEIKKLDTDKLIKFLESQDLNLKKHHFDIIRDQEITERPFSSYKTQKDLKEILMKHRIDGNGIGAICQFLPSYKTNIAQLVLEPKSSDRNKKRRLEMTFSMDEVEKMGKRRKTNQPNTSNGISEADENIDLSQRPPLVQLAHRRHQHQPQDGKVLRKAASAPTYPLKNDDEELQLCIKEIKRKLGNIGTIIADSNKAISIAPQLEFVGEENTGRVDYAIKALEELFASRKGTNDAFREYFDYIYGIVMTATEWYFILYTTNGISCTSRDPLNIKFSESALKKDSEADIELQKNVKRVMEVIVGLLKDRTDVEKELAIKRQRVQKFKDETRAICSD